MHSSTRLGIKGIHESTKLVQNKYKQARKHLQSILVVICVCAFCVLLSILYINIYYQYRGHFHKSKALYEKALRRRKDCQIRDTIFSIFLHWSLDPMGSYKAPEGLWSSVEEQRRCRMRPTWRATLMGCNELRHCVPRRSPCCSKNTRRSARTHNVLN